MLDDLVRSFLPRVPVDQTMRAVDALSVFDRYQASLGIERAAEWLCEHARRAGLTRVEYERFDADGAARWWSFHAPVAWTPVRAQLEARVRGESVLRLDHALVPFSVATYSRETLPGGVVAPLVTASAADMRGAVVVVTRGDLADRDVFAELTSRGALGFVTDMTAVQISGEGEFTGRIELSPNTSLFGFSLTTSELARVRSAALQGGEVHAIVEIDRSASMPVVSAVLEGDEGAGEVWLTAHLCHPRPGANDNASGVAALLGVATALERAAHRRQTVRFLWGPEFVGVAAYLHRTLERHGTSGLPTSVINMDMVGEDQTRCQCPLILEHAPERVPSLLGPLAEATVAQVFRHTASHPGHWRAGPFMGFSDHALFADPSIGRPAIQLCHAPDRYNHCSGDTIDKVSPVELQRSMVVAAVITHVMAGGRVLTSAARRKILDDYAERRRARALTAARAHGFDEQEPFARALVQHDDDHLRELAVLADGARPLAKCARVPGGSGLKRSWSGPFNTRAMLQQVSAATRDRVAVLARRDKRTLSLLLGLALQVDGSRDREELVLATSLAQQVPIAPSLGGELCDVLLESGWVIEP